jgi:predicted transcriptional regulator
VIAGQDGATLRPHTVACGRKGHVRHEEQGLRYVYVPVTPRHAVRQSALLHTIETFFEGSTEKMLSTLLGSGKKISEEELQRLSDLIEKAKKGTRK